METSSPVPPLPPNAYSRGAPVVADRFAVNVRHCENTGNDITLSYQTFGSPYAANRGGGAGAHGKRRKKPVLLLIPGLGSSCYTWRDHFCEQLAVTCKPSLPSSPSTSANVGGANGETTAASDEDGFYVIRMDNRDAGLSSHLDSAPTLTSPASKLAVTVLPRWWWTGIAAAAERFAAHVVFHTSCFAAFFSQRRAEVPKKKSSHWPVLLTSTPPYTVEDMARDAEALLTALRLDEPDAPSVHLMGISMGGIIAQTLFLRLLESATERAVPVRDSGEAAESARDRGNGCVKVASLTLVATHSGAPVRSSKSNRIGPRPSCPAVATTAAGLAGGKTESRGASLLIAVLFLPWRLFLSFLTVFFATLAAVLSASFVSSGWSWQVIWAMIAASSSMPSHQNRQPVGSSCMKGARTLSHDSDDVHPHEHCSLPCEHRESPVHSSALSETMAQRQLYATNFYGDYPLPDPVAYRQVKAIDLTRAPADAAATMRQLWALQLSPPLTSLRVRRTFHSFNRIHRNNGVQRNDAKSAVERTVPVSTTMPQPMKAVQTDEDAVHRLPRILLLHGLQDNTVDSANAFSLAALYGGHNAHCGADTCGGGNRCGEGAGWDTKLVLFPRMGHSLPAELYADIAAEVRTYCLH